MSDFDKLTLSDPDEEPQRRHPARRSIPQRQVRKPQRATPAATRPAGVSALIWGLAEHWLAEGQSALGHRPPMVNQANFSERLSTQVNSEPGFRKLNPAKVNDLVSRMIKIFWSEIEVGQIHGVHQMMFLDPETWEYLRDRASTSLRIDKVRAGGFKTRPYSLDVATKAEVDALRLAARERASQAYTEAQAARLEAEPEDIDERPKVDLKGWRDNHCKPSSDTVSEPPHEGDSPR